MVIAEAAAAIFDIGFLEEGGVTELGAARDLVFDSGLDIILFLIDDAAGEDGGLEFFEEIEVSFDEAGLDEGGFGLEIGIGDFGAFGEIADGVADFEADIPERVEEAIAEGGHEGGGFSALDCGSVMKEHQIDVAMGV